MPHFFRVPGTFNSSIDESISRMLGRFASVPRILSNLHNGWNTPVCWRWAPGVTARAHHDADSVVLHGDGTLPSRPVRVGARALALSAPQHADARPLATSSSRGVPFRGVGRSLTQFILPDPREVPDASQLPWQTNSSFASESTHRDLHSHARKHARRDERRADGAARDADDADAMQRQLESWYATTDEHNRPTVDPERAAWYAAHENDDYMPPEPPAVEPPASPPLPLFLDRPDPDADPPADDVGVKGGWWMKDPSETAEAVDTANARPLLGLVRDDGRPIGEVRWETRRTARRGWRSRRRRAPSRKRRRESGGFVRDAMRRRRGPRDRRRIDFERSPRRR